MTPNILDKFTYVALGTKTELASPGYNIGDTTINCNDLSEWAAAGDFTAVYFGIDQVDADGNRIDGTYTEWKGIISGSSIGSLELINGTDQNYPAASTTRVYMVITAAVFNSMVDGLLVEHNKQGHHTDITGTSLTVTGAVDGDSLAITADATVGGNMTVTGNVSGANGTFTGLVTAGSATTATGATITPTANDANTYTVTALAAAATIAAPSGTPVEGQSLTLRIKDDGTSRALTWNAIYRALGITLPTATVAGKLMYINMKYNEVDTKWDVLAVGKQA